MSNVSSLLLDDASKPATPWPMAQLTKPCGSVLCTHSVTMTFLAGLLSWIINIDRPSVEEHPKQHNWLDLSPGCLGATWQAQSTLITQLVSGVAGLSASSDISQGSVATHFKSDSDRKKFWKSVNIWWNYKVYKNCAIFWPTLYRHTLQTICINVIVIAYIPSHCKCVSTLPCEI